MRQNFFDIVLKPLCDSIFSYKNAFYIDCTYYTYRQFAERISAIRGVIRAAEKNEQIWGLALHDDLNTYAFSFSKKIYNKRY